MTGRTCGNIPNHSTCRREAPVASMASTAPSSISSIASAVSLPMKPMERAAIAQMPAIGPGPKMATKTSAQTTVLTDREATRMSRPMAQVAVLNVVLRAARKATGKGHRDGRQGAERGDVHGLDQRTQDHVQVGPIRRIHADQQIGGLDVGIEQVDPSDVERAERGRGNEQHPQVPGVADQRLARAEAAPDLRISPAMLVDGHRRRFRIQLEKISPRNTRLMMTIRMARLKS